MLNLFLNTTSFTCILIFFYNINHLIYLPQKTLFNYTYDYGIEIDSLSQQLILASILSFFYIIVLIKK